MFCLTVFCKFRIKNSELQLYNPAPFAVARYLHRKNNRAMYCLTHSFGVCNRINTIMPGALHSLDMLLKDRLPAVALAIQQCGNK